MSELTRFIHSSQKALRLEMAAMRKQLGSFEVALLHDQALGLPSDGSPVKWTLEVRPFILVLAKTARVTLCPC